jgi:hypothetical protein
MTRYAADLRVLAGILATLCARPARAEDPACSPIAVESEASVSAQWHGLAGTVREAFNAREDIDRCARVKLMWRAGSIAVQVALPDGRVALRTASRPEDVVPTLEALLLLPQRDAPLPPLAIDAGGSPSSRPSWPTGGPSAVEGASPLGAEDVPTNRAPTISDHFTPQSLRTPAHLQIELSVATGGRIGDGQMSLGLGALSFLDLSEWLVGFEGRLDRYQKVGGTPSTAVQGPPHGSGALELAVLGGRRVRLKSLALDFLIGPAAAVQGTTTFQTQTAAGTITHSSSSTVPRLLVASRLNFGARSTLHTFVSLDGEFGPSRVGGDDLPFAPRLPVWTLGLALGATVGTQ